MRMSAAAFGVLAIGAGATQPDLSEAAKIDFAEMSCFPKAEKGKKVLVAYASRCGSTGEVAESIGRVLCESGLAADVLLVENVGTIEPYDGIIVGSAIHSSKWLPEAYEFVEKHRQRFSGMPVAYFLTCLTLCRSTEENLGRARGYLDPLNRDIPQVKPVDVGLFGGVLDYSKLSWPVRMIMSRKMKRRGVEEGDYRNWTAIGQWAKGVSAKL
jgi:menaquinone-dependent protoporphyrinogen oxidase